MSFRKFRMLRRTGAVMFSLSVTLKIKSEHSKDSLEYIYIYTRKHGGMNWGPSDLMKAM